ncbi:hypothetical protein GW17_00028573 [Ensete ventricosum]|nr:hypothetical protein GW17_00028573 [Ensete ventricosum]
MCARPRAWLVPAGIGSTRSEAIRGSPVTRAVACKGGRSCRGNAHGQCRPRAFEVTLPELFNMLRGAESTIKKEKSVLYIGETNKKRKASKEDP